MVIPAVDTFEDNYRGQFVFIDEATDTGTDDVPVGSCQFASTWAGDETQIYDGQLLDRRQEEPVAVDLNVYMDGDQNQISPGTHFIIQNTLPCDGEYIGLEGESVTRRALAGKPSGPTVTTNDGGGFGAPLAIVSGLGTIGAWHFARNRSDEE